MWRGIHTERRASAIGARPPDARSGRLSRLRHRGTLCGTGKGAPPSLGRRARHTGEDMWVIRKGADPQGTSFYDRAFVGAGHIARKQTA